MRAYLVGGAVRDALLGRPPGDRDFVVVGATPEEMRAAGYTPVGADFPVFIHPRTGEEYALARTEKKRGRGYRGFTFYAAPDVNLRDDLRRRDLTINAMARDENGALTDPFGGARDLAAKTLRHVSPAFAEDPLRILRVARFAAALPDFAVAEETAALMREMTRGGELADLSAERVWRELQRGLSAARPSRMFQVMRECGALAAVLPEVAALDGTPERKDYHPEGDSFVHTMMTLDAAAEMRLSAEECFAALLHDIGKARTPPHILPSHHGHEARGARLAATLCRRLKTPRRFADLAILACAEHGNVHNALAARPGTVADLLSRLDVFRRPNRAESVLRVCGADFAYWPARRGAAYPQGEFLRAARRAAAAVDSGAVARAEKEKHGGAPDKIAAQIRQARIKEIRKIRAQPAHRAAHEKMICATAQTRDSPCGE
ncbi:MAG: multifunctional CCA addition/repair protein [Gammaproteobacteria bacterium]